MTPEHIIFEHGANHDQQHQQASAGFDKIPRFLARGKPRCSEGHARGASTEQMMGYTTRLYPTSRGSARHAWFQTTGEHLTGPIPAALGTQRWICLLQTTRGGGILAVPIMQDSFCRNCHDLHVTKRGGSMGWQNLLPLVPPPNGISLPSIELVPKREEPPCLPTGHPGPG